jgi:hypothetical protein
MPLVIFQINSKAPIFGHMFVWTFWLCLDVNNWLFKYVQAFRDTLSTENRSIILPLHRFRLDKVIFPEMVKVSDKFSPHKSKDKFVPVHCMKTYGRVEASIYSFFTSTLDDEEEWSATRPCRFSYRERNPTTHWMGGRMAPETAWTLSIV